MKLVGLCVFRNEADVLEAFVRHHARLFDRLVLVDHRSTDGGGDVVRALIREGLPVELEVNEALEHVQVIELNRHLRRAIAAGADWVIPLDADELLTGAEPGTDVRAAIERLPRDVVARVPWRTYVPTAGDDPAQRDLLRRVVHHRDRENPDHGKVLVPAGPGRTANAYIAPGNHALVLSKGPGKRWRQELPSAWAPGLVMAHFPVRSAEQVATKAIVGWLATLAKPERRAGENSHWKALYDAFRAQRALTPAQVTDIALRYALEGDGPAPHLVRRPIDLPPDWRLTGDGAWRLDPVATLQTVAEELALAVADARRPRGLKAWLGLGGRKARPPA